MTLATSASAARDLDEVGFAVLPDFFPDLLALDDPTNGKLSAQPHVVSGFFEGLKSLECRGQTAFTRGRA